MLFQNKSCNRDNLCCICIYNNEETSEVSFFNNVIIKMLYPLVKQKLHINTPLG